MKHRIYVVGIGPGSLQGMTLQAREILDGCDCIVGYDTYIDLIRHYFPDKEFVTTGMTKEVERCRMVRDRAKQGQTVAIVSSGDAGIYGMAEDEIARKTDELLERIGLSAERDTLVKSLPLGWKQKLAFSVSIFHEPKIVFLDEPTGGVDPATRRQFWELIYQAADRGITVFVTTHFMDEAEYCDRISIMVDGVIRALDTPDELKRQFKVATMDDVFQQLAREAVRMAD